MKNFCTFSATFTGNSDVIYYNLVGNFIPPEWRDLVGSQGNYLSKTAKQLLSLIVSCLEPEDNSQSEIIPELQKSYPFFQKAIGVCQRRIRQCIVELEQSGFIHQQLRTIVYGDIKCHNILCVTLAKQFKLYQQKVSGVPEKNYEYQRKNCQPLHIIDNNISIYKSRYSNNVDKFENDLPKNQLNQTKQNEKEQKQSNNSSDFDSSSNGWINKITNKAKNWCTGKKLEEFHPLTEEDASYLRSRSNREFNLSFINKLLMRLSEQRPDNLFYSKKAVLSYMAKALLHEMRQVNLANNENFNFRTREDNELIAQEQYLQQIELSPNTSKQQQLKRKMAAVFDRDLACKLLTSCSFAGVVNDYYKLELTKSIDFTEQVQDVFLNQVRAVYGNHIKQLRIISKPDKEPTAAQTISQSSYLEQLLQQLNHDSIWCKVRQYLVNYYDQYTDRNWFSKLEVVEEDKENKKIILKPATGFIGSWINQHYACVLRNAFNDQGFSYELVRV